MVVATDDERIASAVRGFGGEAQMTSPDCASGTDRVAEAARGLSEEIILNLQGDEPMMDPSVIDPLFFPGAHPPFPGYRVRQVPEAPRDLRIP
jgi:3-deoxy-manno-octulosonate cytidylyltransferase (CMP-KDO synthetase)